MYQPTAVGFAKLEPCNQYLKKQTTDVTIGQIFQISIYFAYTHKLPQNLLQF